MQQTCRANRRLGLGIMGLADLLYLCRLPYDSEEGRALAARIMREIREEADRTSEELGRQKGSFPNYHLSVHAGTGKPRRNAATTCIAPTGERKGRSRVHPLVDPPAQGRYPCWRT